MKVKKINIISTDEVMEIVKKHIPINEEPSIHTPVYSFWNLPDFEKEGKEYDDEVDGYLD